MTGMSLIPARSMVLSTLLSILTMPLMIGSFELLL